ncbi:MAG: sugar-binding protein [Spirochaetota bacterium]
MGQQKNIGNWDDLEPEQGKFQWRRVDTIVALAQQKGIDLVVCIPGTFLYKPERPIGKWEVPEWARKRDRLGNPDGKDGTFGWCKSPHRVILPQLDDWRNFVKAYAERYTGKIPYYEIFNEPNWYLSPEYYLEYLQVASEEIRKADPAAKIVGICATSDDNADQNGFIEDCLKLGAAKYCDIITFHPYTARIDNGKPYTAMEGIRATKGLLSKYNIDKPLWNGEMYYLVSSFHPYVSLSADEFTADAITRCYAIDMGERLGASFPLYYEQLFANCYLPNTYFPTLRHAANVTAKFAANSAAGHFLNGAVPLKTIETADVLCYLYKNDDKLFSAAWALRDPVELSVTLPPNAAVTAHDMFGTVLERHSGKMTLGLDRPPLWLEWTGADAVAAGQSLEKMTVRGKNNLKLGRAIISKDGYACISISNISGATVNDVLLRMEAASFEAPIKSEASQFAANESKIFLLPIQIKGNPEAIPLTVFAGTSERMLKQSMVAGLVETLPVEKDRFTEFTSIVKTVDGKIDSENDLAAQFSVSYDDEGYLLVRVKVIDDAAGAIIKDAPWDEDCIEIFIDVFPLLSENLNQAAYNKSTFQIAVSPRRTDARITSNKLKGVTLSAVKADGAGYKVEIKIPLSDHLGTLQGKFIGFDIAIDDSDSNKRKSQTVWSGSSDNYQNRSRFGILKFK